MTRVTLIQQVIIDFSMEMGMRIMNWEQKFIFVNKGVTSAVKTLKFISS
jgi:hypothetical protein